jgi:hypothetical protein
MLHGDLSNKTEPVILFTWEGLLAKVPPELEEREKRLVEKAKLTKWLGCWEENEHMRSVLVDLTWRKNRSVYVLTFYPLPFATRLGDRLGDEGYPCAGVICGYPRDGFHTQLAMMPWVVVIYHGERLLPLLWGTRGQYVDAAYYSGADL